MIYKKLFINLTPLLDLLLVIIFAFQIQLKKDADKKISEKRNYFKEKTNTKIAKIETEAYKEIEKNRTKVEREAKYKYQKIIKEKDDDYERLHKNERKLKKNLEVSKKEYSDLQKKHNNDIAQLEKKLVSKEKEIETLKSSKTKLKKNIQKRSENLRNILTISTEVLEEQEDLLNDKLKEKTKREIERIIGENTRDTVINLQQLGDMSKYFDVWSVVLCDNNFVDIKFGSRKERFNFQYKRKDAKKNFVEEIEKIRKEEVGEPKSMVMISYGYTEKAGRHAWKKLKEAMKEWRESLKLDFYKKKFYNINIEEVPK